MGLWGSSARRVAISRVGIEVMGSPSRTTVPDDGVSSRAMVRSIVDLPHPLGPIDGRDLAVGDGQVEVAHDRRAAVPDGEA